MRKNSAFLAEFFSFLSEMLLKTRTLCRKIYTI